MTELKYQEEGRCPKCGKRELDYGAIEPMGKEIYYPFTCRHCEAEGKEYYTVEYSGSELRV